MINFTEEHKSKLEALFLKLGFKGAVLAGKFGANNYNVIDILHNSTLQTLQGIHLSLKKDIASLEAQDEWSQDVTSSAKSQQLKDWGEYVNLVIGYKKFSTEQAEIAKQLRAEKAQKLAQLKAIKGMKEIEALNSLSLEDLEKEIEKYQ